MTSVLIRNEKGKTHTGEKVMWRQRQRLEECLQAREHQGSHRKLGERQGIDSPSVCRRNQSYWHFSFRILASRIRRKYISLVLNHRVYGNLLRQPQETNAPNSFRVVANWIPSPKPPTWFCWGLVRISFKVCQSWREKAFPGHSWKQISWQLPPILTLKMCFSEIG